MLFILVSVTVLAYGNSFSTGFPLDNKGLILDDARVHAATRENVALILGHSYWWPIGESGLYRPLTTLSYLFNFAILGNEDRPAGYHALNLLLHVANVLLVYAIVCRIVRARTPSSQGPQRKSISADPAFSVIAFCVAALWAVHPLATEAVTNIVGRADLLAACGVLAGLISYLHARETSGSRRFAWLLALAAATAVGVFSKESAVVAVFLIALFEVAWWNRRSARASVSAAVALAIPLFVWWQQRSAVLGASAAEFPFVDNPIAGAGFPRGLLTAVAVMGRYLSLLVWPAKLSADYSYAQVPLAAGSAADWLAWIVVGALAAIVVASFRRRPVVFFFGAFAFLTFLPASNLLFPTGTIMAERLMYLPSVGLMASLALAVNAVPAGPEMTGRQARHLHLPAAAAPALVAIAVIALAVRTWTRNPDWFDNMTLWTATVQAAPSSFKAHRALAEAIYESDAAHRSLDGAIAEMDKSTAILASLPDARNDARTHRALASYHLEEGDAAGSSALQQRTPLPSVSVDAYRKAIAMAKRTVTILDASLSARPHAAASADAYRLLSAAYVRVGDNAPAVDAAIRARALEPSSVVGHRQLAAALLSADRYEDAGVALMTGALLTNSPELRQQLMDLYRQGLDPLGCAVTASRDGPTLSPACPTVRRHLCAATAEAILLQNAVGQRADAERLRTSANELGCAAISR